ncbi:MAG: hypothetical protein ACYTGQ_08890 [Planctomycetota bacterium]|jgi:hypothetical protein
MADRTLNIATSLLVTRLAWGALLMGQVAMGMVFGAMALTAREIVPEFAWGCGVAAWVGLVIVTPFGLWLRGQYFKRGWQGDVVNPGAYMTGMVIALVLNQAAFFASLIACLFDAQLLPYGVPAMFAGALHLLLWPNGKAMRPHPEALARARDGSGVG